MALKFHPKPGTIVVCHYEPGFRKPEMVKSRPAIIISPRLRKRNGLCAVVPLSTTEPNPVEPWHHKIIFERSFPRPFPGSEKWAKCDMVATVGFHRLELIRLGKEPRTGQRKYLKLRISAEDLVCVRKAVLAGLGILDS